MMSPQDMSSNQLKGFVKGVGPLADRLLSEISKSPAVKQRMINAGAPVDPKTGVLMRPGFMQNKARGTMSSATYTPMGGMF